jgi:hypothetical protein
MHPKVFLKKDASCSYLTHVQHANSNTYFYSLFVWRVLVVNDRKFLAETIFFFHTNQQQYFFTNQQRTSPAKRAGCSMTLLKD